MGFQTSKTPSVYTSPMSGRGEDEGRSAEPIIRGLRWASRGGPCSSELLSPPLHPTVQP